MVRWAGVRRKTVPSGAERKDDRPVATVTHMDTLNTGSIKCKCGSHNLWHCRSCHVRSVFENLLFQNRKTDHQKARSYCLDSHEEPARCIRFIRFIQRPNQAHDTPRERYVKPPATLDKCPWQIEPLSVQHAELEAPLYTHTGTGTQGICFICSITPTSHHMVAVGEVPSQRKATVDVRNGIKRRCWPGSSRPEATKARKFN